MAIPTASTGLELTAPRENGGTPIADLAPGTAFLDDDGRPRVVASVLEYRDIHAGRIVRVNCSDGTFVEMPSTAYIQLADLGAPADVDETEVATAAAEYASLDAEIKRLTKQRAAVKARLTAAGPGVYGAWEVYATGGAPIDDKTAMRELLTELGYAIPQKDTAPSLKIRPAQT